MFPQVKRDLPQDTPWVFLNKSLPLMKTKPLSKTFEWPLVTFLQKSIAFNEIGTEMADPDADFDKLMEEMGQLQTEIDAADAWDLDSQLSQAMDALQMSPTPMLP